MITQCRRGHASERNRFGQCIECLRETRRAYKRRTVKSQPPASIVTPAVISTAVLQETLAAPGSFLAVAREYIAANDAVAPKTAQKREYLLKQLAAIHARPIAALTRPEIVQVLKGIESVGDRRESAHRCAMTITQILRFAANHGYVAINVLPAGELKGTLRPVKVESHAAVVDPAKFGQLVRMIDLYAGFINSKNHPSVAAALRIAPLLFVRPGELRHAEWAEFDLDKAEWIIPKEKMKMRRPHLVPLSQQSLALLRHQHGSSGTGRWVFPSKARTSQRHGAEQPISENGFREALHTVLNALEWPRTVHTMHGWRSSASTLLNGELGVDSALVELQLAHVKGDKVAGIYDRSQRLPERRAMMQRWSDYIDELRKSAQASAEVQS